MAEYISRPIPIATRRRNAGITFCLTLSVTVLVLLYVHAEGHFGWATLGLAPFTVFGLFQSCAFLFTKETRVPTPEAEAAQAAAEEQDRREQAEFEDKWYYRYSFAALLLFAAYHVANRWPDFWWASVLIVLAAAFQARELSLMLLGVGCLYLVVQGIAALPTSLAIILGALIIATALGGSRSG